MLIALGILLFVLLVVVHEFGHYYAAKKNGVMVEEFGIGFPPRITGKKFRGDDTLYSLNWLPLGGFVRLKGEHDSDKGEGTYGAAPFNRKVVILLAGVGMNLVAAVVILTFVSFIGIPRLLDNQFTISSDTKVSNQYVVAGFVAEGSPAESSGIEVGDKVYTFAGQEIKTSDQLFKLTEQTAGQSIDFCYWPLQANKDTQTPDCSVVTLNEERDEQQGYFGISPSDVVFEKSTWSAPIKAVGLTIQFFWETLYGLVSTIGKLFVGQASEAAANVAGPIGIVVLLQQVAQAGYIYLLFFIALISITLAVMNALPVPALDGGRLFVSWLFRVLKKPLNAQLEERIHATGMAVLLILIALISVVDVRRFF